MLNSLVWPSILDLIRGELNVFSDSGVRLVILEAAVLLEASWDKICGAHCLACTEDV